MREPEAPQREEIPSEEPARRVRVHERAYAAQIECPVCEDTLDVQSSILQSVRCEGCGHLLAFDEVLALRNAEYARASRYS